MKDLLNNDNYDCSEVTEFKFIPEHLTSYFAHSDSKGEYPEIVTIALTGGEDASILVSLEEFEYKINKFMKDNRDE